MKIDGNRDEEGMQRRKEQDKEEAAGYVGRLQIRKGYKNEKRETRGRIGVRRSARRREIEQKNGN